MSASPRFELQLCGRFGLRCLSQSPDLIPISSKKARALLAYTAMQEAMQCSRERLATVLWPDRIDRQARQNLRACLASLRADLGGLADELLMVDGETVAIRTVIAVDARQVRKLAATDQTIDLEDAVRLYRGPFLADLTIDVEEFCDWASAERAELDSVVGDILAKLARHADERGEASKAVRFSSRLTALDPFREDWFRLSLTIAARHQGRDKALLQAKSFVGLLRKELDVAPEAETGALIEQIKSGGSAPIERDETLARRIDEAVPALSPERRITAPPDPPVPPPAMRAAGRAPVKSAIIAAGIALLIAFLFVAYQPQIRSGFLKPHTAGNRVIDQSTIALVVAPFQSQTADASDIAGELTESVLASVSRFSGLTVFDGRLAQVAPGEPAGAELAGFLSWGSVRRQGSIVDVRVGLTDTATQTVVWANDYTQDGGQISDPDGEISRRIARDLQVQATYAAARGVDDANPKLASLSQLIAKALTVQYRSPTPDDDAPAAALYEEALRRNPDCALALIGLAARLVAASANLLSERNSALDRAEKLIGRALQIDPRIERAHYWIGNIYLERGQRGLALQSFDRALELNPSFLPAEAHAGFALVLLGQIDEGLRRIDNALRQSSHDPNERLWLRFAAIAQLERGDDKQAIDTLLQAASLANPTPPLRAALASAYALTGERAKGREQFQLLKEAANPAALQRLLNAASKSEGRQGSRYLQGLRLAAADTL